MTRPHAHASTRPGAGGAPRPPVADRLPLDSVDHAWLRMDDPTNLMVVTGVLMFDDRLRMPQLRDLVSNRLLRLPRFSQRVTEDLLGGAWEPAPDFDLDDHLVAETLPEGDDAEAALQALCSALMIRPFDPAKPRWQFHLVEHYGTGSALVLRVHHCIGDGLALIYVLLSMSDDGPMPQLDDSADRCARPGGWLDSRRARARHGGGGGGAGARGRGARRRGGDRRSVAPGRCRCARRRRAPGRCRSSC